MAAVTRTEARKALHDAGWDYWMTRMHNAADRGADKEELERYVAQLDAILPLLDAEGVHPRPTITKTSYADGRPSTTEFIHFYDVDEITPQIQAAVSAFDERVQTH